jgi:hypothetical protein
MQNPEEEWQRLGQLKPSEKVAIMFEMINATTDTCAAGIRAQNPSISEEELLEKLRERIEMRKRLERGS